MKMRDKLSDKLCQIDAGLTYVRDHIDDADHECLVDDLNDIINDVCELSEEYCTEEYFAEYKPNERPK